MSKKLRIIHGRLPLNFKLDFPATRSDEYQKGFSSQKQKDERKSSNIFFFLQMMSKLTYFNTKSSHYVSRELNRKEFLSFSL